MRAEVQRGDSGSAGEWIAADDVSSVTARYLIGADGASSAVREIIGSPFNDLGLVPFDWLILDVIPHDQERVWSPMNWQLCDPARWGMTTSSTPISANASITCASGSTFSAVLGEVICVLDPEQAALRDARMLAGEADPARVLPAAPPQRLGTGLTVDADPVAGTSFIQRVVERGGRRGLFDDVIGVGFVIIGARDDPAAGLDDEQQAVLDEIDAHVVWVSGDETQRRGRAFDDVERAYADWFALNGCEVALVRPDGYVYGTAATGHDVPTLVDGLRRALKFTKEPAAEAVSR